MSSVLQVQMLHDQGVDEGLKARFAFMDSPPEEQAAEAEAEDGAMRMDMGAYACVYVDRRSGETHTHVHQPSSCPGSLRSPRPPHRTDGARSASSQSSIPGEVTVEEIHRFVEGVFTRGRFSAECNIIALVYINRVISSTGMPLHKGNWK